ncbi:hypothetical protein PGN35_012575 [Nodosilinea sp. PGN35]|uniref:hypothetical protein n=1 Tax=Nodosilinea sp. PGN35 TaxID=3020489 RepID=UPI0023B3341E|nr:hypothetical protein [Nodosilinea sp. TSF1-S3]MDF0368606.1 hypothetical protein [Nodosilinea sp. TSF1-S3]
MFDYLEPDASGASNLPPAQTARPYPRPERVRHLLYGSLAGIDRTIKILHAYGYADPNDWSDPIPVPSADTPPQASSAVVGAAASPEMPWMVILTKTLLLE